MTREPVVSVGIPFLNARATLADAIRSVLAQTWDDWELLLVDDGSSDGSVQVARAVLDARVRVIWDGAHQGLTVRLNQIASLARGRHLARMDADDLMHPERLRRQVHFLEANPRVDLVDTATVTIDEANEPLGIRGDRPLDTDPRAVLRSGLLLHPTVTGRTAWFRANPYDRRFVRAEDHELWVRTCRSTAFARLNEPLFFYREGLSGNLRNYLRSARTVRKILRVYGPAAVGLGATALLLARSYLKSCAYWTYTKLGRQDRLIRARTRPLEPDEAAAARAALRAILQTPLPTGQRADHEQATEHAALGDAAELSSAARLHGAADAGFPLAPGGVRAESGR
jgi:glycosyltransferase involved in cell wall biosynthesis